MNYSKQLKGFFLRRRFHPVSLTAILYYYMLFDYFEAAGFPSQMSIPMAALVRELDMPRRTVIRARDELVKKGYLVRLTQNGKKKSVSYAIVPLSPEDYGGTDNGEVFRCDLAKYF